MRFSLINLNIKVFYVLSIIVLTTACNSVYQTKNHEKVYRKAVEHAMYPTAKKVAPLLTISSDNKSLVRKMINGEEHILVVTWKAKNYYPAEGEYNTGNYEIWVTAAPELYNRMHNIKPKYQAIRLKQLLGLPPNAQNKVFIEFWVKPVDLIRPCPDKEVNDNTCNLCFTAKDSLDKTYIEWINKGRIDRYYATELYNQYPWTQLGYTYDWNKRNRSHSGLSEFVIGTNKTIYVHKSYTIEDYLKAKKD